MKRNIAFLILGAITVTMIFFKMNREIDLSWWWIFAPLWVPVALGIVFIILFGIITYIWDIDAELYECIGCEGYFRYEKMTQDNAGEDYCPECWKHFEPHLKAEYEELVKNGEIEA